MSWVSVDERLPDEGEAVLLVFNVDGEGWVDVGGLYTYVPTWDEIATVPYKYWDHPINDGQDWDFDIITHWMPLPELPCSEIHIDPAEVGGDFGVRVTVKDGVYTHERLKDSDI